MLAPSPPLLWVEVARLPSRGTSLIVDRGCPYPHLSRSSPGFTFAAPSLKGVLCGSLTPRSGRGECPLSAHAHPRVATRRRPGGFVLFGRSKVIHSNSRESATPKTPRHLSTEPLDRVCTFCPLRGSWRDWRLFFFFFLERLISGEWLSSFFTHRVPVGAVR